MEEVEKGGGSARGGPAIHAKDTQGFVVPQQVIIGNVIFPASHARDSSRAREQGLVPSQVGLCLLPLALDQSGRAGAIVNEPVNGRHDSAGNEQPEQTNAVATPAQPSR